MKKIKNRLDYCQKKISRWETFAFITKDNRRKKIWQQKVNRRKRNLMAEWRETGTKKHGGGNTKLSFC